MSFRISYEEMQLKLQIIQVMMRFDGDIPLFIDRDKPESCDCMNQCDFLIKEYHPMFGYQKLYYVCTGEKCGNVEALVILDDKGRVTYFDQTHEHIVFHNEIYEGFPLSRIDMFNDIIDNFEIEGGPDHIKEGVINCIYQFLKDIVIVHCGGLRNEWNNIQYSS